MKLDDLIKYYEGLKLDNDDVNIDNIINNLKEFRILNKPCVDKFIADWYEEYKDDLEFNIWDWVKYTQEEEKIKNRQFTEWIGESENKPVETLVKMKLFGYSVKKEKKYIIKIKNVQKDSESFKFDKVIGKWYFGFDQESYTTRLYHTKEDIVNAGFGWMFSCQGFEIEEVDS